MLQRALLRLVRDWFVLNNENSIPNQHRWQSAPHQQVLGDRYIQHLWLGRAARLAVIAGLAGEWQFPACDLVRLRCTCAWQPAEAYCAGEMT